VGLLRVRYFAKLSGHNKYEQRGDDDMGDHGRRVGDGDLG